MKISIGKAGKEDVSLDLETLLTTRMLLTADSGGGKTFALKRIIEKAFGKIQILVIDPEGEFSPLRENFDFVLVGKGGETVADTRSAKLVAQTLLKLRANAICDLYEMKPSERHTWVREFCDGLLDAPKEHRHPCLVIVDEAHLFAPEHGKGESVASDAVIGLCTRGRKRLLVPLFATQRLATLSKDASSMLLNRMVGGTFEDVNRKRAAEVLGIAKEKKVMQTFYDEIKTLDPGYFFCLGRAITKERTLVHVGSIKTAHGQDALKYEITPPPPPDKIKALLPKLSDLPKQAEEKARTEAELRAEVRTLKAQLRSQPVTQALPVVNKTLPKVKASAAEIRRILQEEIEPWRDFSQDVRRKLVDTLKVVNELWSVSQHLNEKARDHLKAIGVVPDYPVLHPDLKSLKAQVIHDGQTIRPNPPVHIPHRAEARPHPAQHGQTRTASTVGGNNGDALPKGEKEILIAIARYDEGVERNQLTVLTGFKRSTRDAYIARLKPRGLVDERGGRIVATDAGIAALGSDYTPQPASGDELQRYWMSELPEGEKKVLQLLIAEAGRPLQRQTIDELGFSRSTRDAYLSRLSAKRLIEYEGRGQVKAAPALFA